MSSKQEKCKSSHTPTLTATKSQQQNLLYYLFNTYSCISLKTRLNAVTHAQTPLSKLPGPSSRISYMKYPTLASYPPIRTPSFIFSFTFVITNFTFRTQHEFVVCSYNQQHITILSAVFLPKTQTSHSLLINSIDNDVIFISKRIYSS